jgi:hypothetical protein
MLYYCTLISPRFNHSRIFAEALKAGTYLYAKLCKKECRGKLSAEHYYNAIRAKLQFCVQIYKSGVQIYKPPILLKFRPFYCLMLSMNSAGVTPVIFWKFLTAVVR